MDKSPTLVAVLLCVSACKPAAPEPAAPAPTAAARAAPAAAPTPSAQPQELTCDYPVKAGDTAATVLARFGKDAKRATLPGPEGSEFKGVVLWDKDPARRIELIVNEDSKNERITGVTVREPGSKWVLAGLKLGSPLADVVSANGGDFLFYGFEWDYGGYVTDLRGGKLDRKEFGCGVNLRLTYEPDGTDQEDTEGVIGDTEVRSSHPKLVGLKVMVDELGLNWRQP